MFDHTYPEPRCWRVVYEAAGGPVESLWLGLQIGEKGQAVLALPVDAKENVA